MKGPEKGFATIDMFHYLFVRPPCKHAPRWHALDMPCCDSMQIPGLYKIRHIGQTTVTTAAVSPTPTSPNIHIFASEPAASMTIAPYVIRMASMHLLHGAEYVGPYCVVSPAIHVPWHCLSLETKRGYSYMQADVGCCMLLAMQQW